MQLEPEANPERRRAGRDPLLERRHEPVSAEGLHPGGEPADPGQHDVGRGPHEVRIGRGDGFGARSPDRREHAREVRDPGRDDGNHRSAPLVDGTTAGPWSATA